MDIHSISSISSMDNHQAVQASALEQQILLQEEDDDDINEQAIQSQFNSQLSQQQQINDPSAQGVQMDPSTASNNFFVQFSQTDSQH